MTFHLSIDSGHSVTVTSWSCDLCEGNKVFHLNLKHFSSIFSSFWCQKFPSSHFHGNFSPKLVLIMLITRSIILPMLWHTNMTHNTTYRAALAAKQTCSRCVFSYYHGYYDCDGLFETPKVLPLNSYWLWFIHTASINWFPHRKKQSIMGSYGCFNVNGKWHSVPRTTKNYLEPF